MGLSRRVAVIGIGRVEHDVLDSLRSHEYLCHRDSIFKVPPKSVERVEGEFRQRGRRIKDDDTLQWICVNISTDQITDRSTLAI